ncbi:MAG: hypothetical protein WCE87_03295 [Candidatus Udaeobacter sp.]
MQVVAAAADGEDVDLEKAVDSLIATEKAFTRRAGKKSRDACVSILADDALIFPPNAVNGKSFSGNVRLKSYGLVGRSVIESTPKMVLDPA